MDSNIILQLEKEVEFLKKKKMDNVFHLPSTFLVILVIVSQHLPHDYSKYFLYIFPVVAVLAIVLIILALSESGKRLDSEKRLFALLENIISDEKKKV